VFKALLFTLLLTLTATLGAADTGLIIISKDSKQTPKTGIVPYTKIFNDKQIKCLADNIYFEARGEKSIGKKAVALITINRLKHDKFANTICGVVYEKTPFGKCQFSWTCNRYYKITDYAAYKKCKKIAINVIVNYDYIHDFTHGATFFHNHKAAPKWSRKHKKTISIGKHTFYKI
jgi:spore germination cell wall hydrolase CwlJ-like protein